MLSNYNIVTYNFMIMTLSLPQFLNKIKLIVGLHVNEYRFYIKVGFETLHGGNSIGNQRFFSEPTHLIRDSHYMVLPQTFPDSTFI